MHVTYIGFRGVIQQYCNSHSQKYIHRTDKGDLRLFDLKKENRQDGAIYKPLNFRDLVLLSNKFIEDIKEDSDSIDTIIGSLNIMRAKKENKLRKRWLVTLLVICVWERIKNWWGGYGVNTSVGLARNLTNKLKEYSRPATPQQIPSPTHLSPFSSMEDLTPGDTEEDEPYDNVSSGSSDDSDEDPLGYDSPSHSRTSSPVHTPRENEPYQINLESNDPSPTPLSIVEQEQPASSQSTEVVNDTPIKKPLPRPLTRKPTLQDLYRQDSCSDFQKKILFSAVEAIEKPKTLMRPQHSFVDLLKEIFPGVEVSKLINTPDGIKMVCDMLKHGNKEAQAQMSGWLQKQPYISPDTFFEVLRTNNEKHLTQIDFFALTELLTLFKTNTEINGPKEWKGLSITHEAVQNSICILLEIAPNNDAVCEHVRWISSKPDFTQDMHNAYIKVLDDKEIVHGKSLENPARDILNAAHPQWKTPRIQHAVQQPEVYVSKLKTEGEKNLDENNANNIPLQRQPKNKITVLNNYIQHMQEGTIKQLRSYQRTIFYQDLKFVRVHPHSVEERAVTSIEDLLRIVGGTPINFEMPIVQSIIKDLMLNLKMELRDRFAEWLANEPTCNNSALTAALTGIVAKYNSQTTNNLRDMEQLVHALIAQEKNVKGADKPADITSEIVDAIKILVHEKPEDAQTTKILENVKKRLTAIQKTQLLAILDEKEAAHQHRTGGAPPIAFSIRTLLA